jgi:hypothetical protein
MDMTTHKDLREIDQRIAALNISLTTQLADINLTLNTRLTEIQANLDHHRWQTHHHRKDIFVRLAKLEEAKPSGSRPWVSMIDPVIIARALFLAGMAATGVISWVEVGKIAIN